MISSFREFLLVRWRVERRAWLEIIFATRVHERRPRAIPAAGRQDS